MSDDELFEEWLADPKNDGFPSYKANVLDLCRRVRDAEREQIAREHIKRHGFDKHGIAAAIRAGKETK